VGLRPFPRTGCVLHAAQKIPNPALILGAPMSRDLNGHEPPERVRPHYSVTFALLAMAAVSYALLQSLVAPALPGIQHALRTSVNSASWVLTAYLLSASSPHR
jgi:hypothetical protein